MASPAPSDDPDSRTSSVGRKRVFNQFASEISDAVTIEDDSSAEESEHLEKRARHDDGSHPASISPKTKAIDGDISDTDGNQRTAVAEQNEPTVTADGSDGVDFAGAMPPSISWNKGVPSTIRTSFDVRSSSKLQPFPSHAISHQKTDEAELDARQESDQRETEDELSNDSELEESAGISKTTLRPSKKREKSPRSAFGGSKTTKTQALLLISRLPETQRGLMPREISDNEAIYYSKGQQFKLPRESHPDKAMWALKHICFRDNEFGFIDRFLNANRSILEHVDFDLVVSAFQAYLEKFYGHLPMQLRDMVLKNRKFVGKSSRDKFTGRLARFIQQSYRKQPDSIVKEMDQNSHEYIPVAPLPRSAQFLGPNDDNTADIPSCGSMEHPIASTRIEVADVQVLGFPEPVKDESEIDRMELELLRKYHPGIAENTFLIHCLTCGQHDHKTSECPFLACVTCGLKDAHFTGACPQMYRCTKCRRRGHQKLKCPEKLTATSSDAVLHCDICQSFNHIDEACHYLWRTFKPSQLEIIRVVADIPKECYCCGASGHYGPECALRHNPLLTEGYTWSTANWKQYVDPASKNVALSIGKDYSLPPPAKAKKMFSIRGKAHKDSTAGDDNDDELQFINERVQKAPRPVPKGKQHIKFDSSRHAAYAYDSNDRYEPPLPPRDTLPPPLLNNRRNDPRVTTPSAYRPPIDSARYRRERSFSPPPRFPGDRYEPQLGANTYREHRENSYRPGERTPAYRLYDNFMDSNERGRGGDDDHFVPLPSSRPIGRQKGPKPSRAGGRGRGRGGAS